MTEPEITAVLTATGHKPYRDSNLSRALAGLARHGLIHLERGHWAARTWVPTKAAAIAPAPLP
jgi:hypothetical protein